MNKTCQRSCIAIATNQETERRKSSRSHSRYTDKTPTIFDIYINDFPLYSNFFKFIMYADDTTLYSQFDNAEIANHDIEFKINKELSNINDWLNINKLALNIKNI